MIDVNKMHCHADEVANWLKTVAHPERLMVLCQLTRGEVALKELQQHSSLGQSALSQHLAILRREKIVRSRKHAQSVSYSLTGDEATKVMESLHDVFCGAAITKEQMK